MSRHEGYERLPTHSYPPRHNSSLRLSPREVWSTAFARHSSLHPPRLFPRVLRLLTPIPFLLIVVALVIWDPHLEITKYAREWVQREIVPIKPLRGCFRPENVSPLYNVTERLYGPRRTEVQAGFSMRLGMDCFDFAGTIQPPAHPHPDAPPVIFHTYWRTDLAPFGERQEWALKSFLATQPVSRSRIIFWSNGDLIASSEVFARYARAYPKVVETRVADVKSLARGTALEGSPYLNMNDAKAWLDGDIVRLLAMWTEGGVWIDMDMLWTRDVSPLLEHEFVTQWDCFDKIYQTLNGALMHFYKHSPYLCEAFHAIATSDPPRVPSTDWGALLYLKLWRRLVAEGIPPFKVLPSCFSDGGQCRRDNSLPDPFVPDPQDGRWTGGLSRAEGGGLDVRLKNVFAVHLHNQWAKEFPEGGWVRRLLLKKYEKVLGGLDARTPL